MVRLTYKQGYVIICASDDLLEYHLGQVVTRGRGCAAAAEAAAAAAGRGGEASLSRLSRNRFGNFGVWVCVAR